MTDKKKTDSETQKADSENKEFQKTRSTKKDKKKAADIKDKLKAEQEKSRENYDRFLRVSAEFENYKKRSDREMSEFKKFANESLTRDILSVIDNLERAMISSNADNKTNSALMEGVDMTLKEILKILEKFNVTPFESLKKTFDPNFHQAVMTEETDEYDENIVINELQKGYMIHDRLLRPAMVVVSKSKTDTENKI